jgi:hypothetical protein
MNKIKCQGISCKKSGCYVCGGYGVIASEHTLECGCVTWFRPGAYTMYDGKEFSSFSGLDVVCYLTTKNHKNRSGYFCKKHYMEGTPNDQAKIKREKGARSK